MDYLLEGLGEKVALHWVADLALADDGHFELVAAQAGGVVLELGIVELPAGSLR